MNSDFNFGIQFDRGDAIYIHDIEDAVTSIIESAELSSAATLNSNPAGGKHVIKCNGPKLPKSREGFKTEWTISVWIYIASKDDKKYTPGSINRLIDDEGIIEGNYATICESSSGHKLMAIKVYNAQQDAPTQLRGRPVDGLSPAKRDECSERSTRNLRRCKSKRNELSKID